MDERDVLDLLLVVVLAVVTYHTVYGFAEPLAGLARIAAFLASFDVTVYLVLAGVLGVFVVGYITVYLPKKDADRIVR